MENSLTIPGQTLPFGGTVKTPEGAGMSIAPGGKVPSGATVVSIGSNIPRAGSISPQSPGTYSGETNTYTSPEGYKQSMTLESAQAKGAILNQQAQETQRALDLAKQQNIQLNEREANYLAGMNVRGVSANAIRSYAIERDAAQRQYNLSHGGVSVQTVQAQAQMKVEQVGDKFGDKVELKTMQISLPYQTRGTLTDYKPNLVAGKYGWEVKSATGTVPTTNISYNPEQIPSFSDFIPQFFEGTNKILDVVAEKGSNLQGFYGYDTGVASPGWGKTIGTIRNPISIAGLGMGLRVSAQTLKVVASTIGIPINIARDVYLAGGSVIKRDYLQAGKQVINTPYQIIKGIPSFIEELTYEAKYKPQDFTGNILGLWLGGKIMKPLTEDTISKVGSIIQKTPIGSFAKNIQNTQIWKNIAYEESAAPKIYSKLTGLGGDYLKVLGIEVIKGEEGTKINFVEDPYNLAMQEDIRLPLSLTEQALAGVKAQSELESLRRDLKTQGIETYQERIPPEFSPDKQSIQFKIFQETGKTVGSTALVTEPEFNVAYEKTWNVKRYPADIEKSLKENYISEFKTISLSEQETSTTLKAKSQLAKENIFNKLLMKDKILKKETEFLDKGLNKNFYWEKVEEIGLSPEQRFVLESNLGIIKGSSVDKIIDIQSYQELALLKEGSSPDIITLYHGTTGKSAKLAIKQGLLPASDIGISRGLPIKLKEVYTTQELERAIGWAGRAEFGKGKPSGTGTAILRIDLPKEIYNKLFIRIGIEKGGGSEIALKEVPAEYIKLYKPDMEDYQLIIEKKGTITKEQQAEYLKEKTFEGKDIDIKIASLNKFINKVPEFSRDFEIKFPEELESVKIMRIKYGGINKAELGEVTDYTVAGKVKPPISTILESPTGKVYQINEAVKFKTMELLDLKSDINRQILPQMKGGKINIALARFFKVGEKEPFADIGLEKSLKMKLREKFTRGKEITFYDAEGKPLFKVAKEIKREFDKIDRLINARDFEQLEGGAKHVLESIKKGKYKLNEPVNVKVKGSEAYQAEQVLKLSELDKNLVPEQEGIRFKISRKPEVPEGTEISDIKLIKLAEFFEEKKYPELLPMKSNIVKIGDKSYEVQSRLGSRVGKVLAEKVRGRYPEIQLEMDKDFKDLTASRVADVKSFQEAIKKIPNELERKKFQAQLKSAIDLFYESEGRTPITSNLDLTMNYLLNKALRERYSENKMPSYKPILTQLELDKASNLKVNLKDNKYTKQQLKSILSSKIEQETTSIGYKKVFGKAEKIFSKLAGMKEIYMKEKAQQILNRVLKDINKDIVGSRAGYSQKLKTQLEKPYIDINYGSIKYINVPSYYKSKTYEPYSEYKLYTKYEPYKEYKSYSKYEKLIYSPYTPYQKYTKYPDIKLPKLPYKPYIKPKYTFNKVPYKPYLPPPPYPNYNYPKLPTYNPPIKKNKKDNEFSAKQLGRGYDVFKILKGKPTPIARGLTRESALDIGTKEILGNLRATFILRKSDLPAREITTGKEFARFSALFREPVARSKYRKYGEAYIQKSTRVPGLGTGRLTSKGEKLEIQSARKNKMEKYLR